MILLLAAKIDKPAIYAIAGILLGLGIFVRPILGIFPLLCAVIIFFLKKKEKNRLVFLSLFLFLTASYSFQLSWSTWKWLSFGHDTTMSRQLKTAFLCGAYPDMTHKDLRGMPYREDPQFMQLMDEKYRTIARYILNRSIEEPFHYLTWWLIKKPIQFWSWKVFFGDGVNLYPVHYSWFDINPFMYTLRASLLALHPFFVILAVIGIFLFLKNLGKSAGPTERLGCFLIIALLTHFTLMFMILAPYPRYALPMGPELYVMSTFALWKISLLKKSRNSISVKTN